MTIHSLEDSLQLLMDEHPDGDRIEEEFAEVWKSLDHYTAINRDVLKRGKQIGIQVETDFLKSHVKSLKNFSHEITGQSKQSLDQIVYNIESLYEDSFSRLIELSVDP